MQLRLPNKIRNNNIRNGNNRRSSHEIKKTRSIWKRRTKQGTRTRTTAQHFTCIAIQLPPECGGSWLGCVSFIFSFFSQKLFSTGYISSPLPPKSQADLVCGNPVHFPGVMRPAAAPSDRNPSEVPAFSMHSAVAHRWASLDGLYVVGRFQRNQ